MDDGNKCRTGNSKKSLGGYDNNKPLTGKFKESSTVGKTHRKYPATMKPRCKDDYYNIQPNQQQSLWIVIHNSNLSEYFYSDLPTRQLFMGPDYSSQSRILPPYSRLSSASVGSSRVSSPNLVQYISDSD